MWYVVQTTVGSEKQIAEKLNRVYSEHAENPCFVLLKERTWRREGIYQIGVEPMFPGYIFVDTEDPQRLEENVHRFAGKAQLLMDGQVFAIESSEEMLFKELIRGDSQHTVRRFLVHANEAGEIVSAEGILGELLGQIVRKRFRKRVVTVEIPFLGKTRQVELSIRVKDDREKTMKEETI